MRIQAYSTRRDLCAGYLLCVYARRSIVIFFSLTLYKRAIRKRELFEKSRTKYYHIHTNGLARVNLYVNNVYIVYITISCSMTYKKEKN